MKDVAHNKRLSRFELSSNGKTAVLAYRETPGAIAFLHTVVPEELKGEGIGSLLVKTGLEYARQNQLRVDPQCTFVAGYIEQHPEYQDLLQSPGG